MTFQNFKFAIYSMFSLFSNSVLIVCFCALISFLLLITIECSGNNRIKIGLVFLVTLITSIIGARLLHVFIEMPSLLNHPKDIFTRFDGMTFNGALIFGLLTLSCCAKLFTLELRKLLWDRLAMATALSYGIIRLSCFAIGCCWGKPTSASWAVKYHSSLVMPWLGIPVHPVQIYDATIGFLIFGILVLFTYKKLYVGLRFAIFIYLYSIGRFVTEFYRGDSFRGENIIFDLSVSQILSLLMTSREFLDHMFERFLYH